jgi:para-aminobenzoate synthetase component 1
VTAHYRRPGGRVPGDGEGRDVTDAADVAVVGGWLATDLRDVTSDPAALDGAGWWAVVLPYDGEPVLARFGRVRRASAAQATSGVRAWHGPEASAWSSDLGRDGHRERVEAIRAAIARGDVYQVNLTRRLSAPLPPDADVLALGRALALAHPAPHAATVRVASAGVHVASASPELFLRRRGRRVMSRPIKGTASAPDRFLPKDRAENVMIVDLVRNDLGRVCEVGSIAVPGLCEVEEHPGLAHLVSTVEGELRPDVGWSELLAAAFPAASITGAPKIAAMQHIRALEVGPRGPYCGAVGWVDADAGEAELNVAIRTFWFADGAVHLGTGGAVTWDSDAAGEWRETELKARALLAVASSEEVVTEGTARATGRRPSPRP